MASAFGAIELPWFRVVFVLLSISVLFKTRINLERRVSAVVSVGFLFTIGLS
jgi:hypothetical protein